VTTSPEQELLVLALETARTAGLLVAAPLAWAEMPARIRGALAFMLAVVGHRYGQGTAVTSPLVAAFAAAPEFLVGVAMGFVVRLAVAAVEIVGEAVSPIMGLGAASLFDPHVQAQETGVTRIFRLLALLLAVLLGLHRVVIASVIASFRVLPAGSFANPALATPVLVRISVEALAQGLRLALPVLAVLVVTQVALAFISRAAPSMQIFSIGFAITLVAGGMTIFVALPDLALEIAADLSRVGSRIEAVVAALVPG
jgi:flagellar biosynthetic protein FliR